MSSPPSLTATQLFTPASSGVLGAGTVPISPATGTWLYWEYQVAAQIGMPTTSWQPGDPERAILAINAVMLSEDDAIISQMAQGGSLDSAASGTVTYQTLNGIQVTIPVTPDPSNVAQNPTGTPGWLDELGQSVYGVTRLAATYANGPLALVNTSATTAGPYLAGAYHVSVLNGATYANQSSLSIPSSAIAGTGGAVAAVSVGLATTYVTTQSAHGLAVGNAVYLVIPPSSGVTGLNGVFALVSGTPTTTQIQVSIGSAGAYTGGGNVYLCTIANFQADVVGTGSSAAVGQITNTVTQANGVSCSNLVAWSGSNWESNTAYVNRCRLSLAAASPNGPAAAYEYFAESAESILSTETPSYSLTNGPVVANTSANPQTGIVTTVVASSTPVTTTLGAAVTPGCAQNLVTGVTGALPCVVTCANPTSLRAGQTMTVIVSGVLGVPTANGQFAATYVSANSFSIPVNTTGLTYTGGGSVEGGDLGMIDNLLQDNVVPDGIVAAVTASALALPITILASVVVPQAYVATYKAAVVASLQSYIASLPIGGVFSASETVPVAYDGVIGALQSAGILTLGGTSYVRQITSATVNGGVIDVPFTSSVYQALLAPATFVTVIGV